jgi:glutamine synthetase
MVGSSQSISGPNFVINTIVAKTLESIADKLEKAADLDKAVQALVKDVWENNGKVIFNGNNYAPEWLDEAAKRGLPNISNTVDAIQVMTEDKNVELFSSQSVLSKEEVHARQEVLLEHYVNTINIEGMATLEIANREILPAGMKFAAQLAKGINSIAATGVSADTSAQADLLTEISSLNASLKVKIKELKAAIDKAASIEEIEEMAASYRDDVFTKMGELREVADKMEVICDEEIWPLPTYGDLLFKV